MGDSIRVRTAMFESRAADKPTATKAADRPPQAGKAAKTRAAGDQKKTNEANNEDFLRNKDAGLRGCERRRHTFETRETGRETDTTERVRRISLDSKSPK